MTTSFRDRTTEFHSMCERIRTRVNTPSSILERRALLSSPEPSHASLNTKNNRKTPHARSEFSMMAAEISRQITNTAAKLEKLTRCRLYMYNYNSILFFFI
jgi:syntaxin 5